MHELALAQNIIEVACQLARENQLSEITEVSIVIGELFAVVFEALEFAFQFSSNGTMAENASLIYLELPTQIRCSNCQHEFLWREFGYRCPECSHVGGEMFQGKEFYINYITGEEIEEKNERNKSTRKHSTGQ